MTVPCSSIFCFPTSSTVVVLVMDVYGYKLISFTAFYKFALRGGGGGQDGGAAAPPRQRKLRRDGRRPE